MCWTVNSAVAISKETFISHFRSVFSERKIPSPEFPVLGTFVSRLCWSAEWGEAQGALELWTCSILHNENRIVCVCVRLRLEILGVVLCGCVSWEIIADPYTTRKRTVWAERRRL
jgi:hypothetical protein